MRTVAAVVALVICVHAGLWALLQRQQAVANIDAPLASVSYSPYARSQHPDYGNRPTPEQIRADLKILSPYTQAIRTYSSTGGGELIPAIAAEFGLKVTLGIWIDKNEARNEREIQAALALARRYSNINAIVVGNEVMLRADKPVDDLISIIRRVKRQSPVPVTTGETFDVWLGITDPNKPEDAVKKAEAATKLASSVDFIAAHILPYWGGTPVDKAVEQTILTYNRLRARHPGKRIVIAEFGWPSGGYNMHAADPGRIEQATVLRDFVSRAEAYGIDYNLVVTRNAEFSTEGNDSLATAQPVSSRQVAGEQRVLVGRRAADHRRHLVGGHELLDLVRAQLLGPVEEHGLVSLDQVGIGRGHLAAAGVEELGSEVVAPGVVPALGRPGDEAKDGVGAVRVLVINRHFGWRRARIR